MPSDIESRRAYSRRYSRDHEGSPKNRLRLALLAEYWHQQNGRCYLCGDETALRGRGPKSAVLEHDHRCCPSTDFCRLCIRGMSCSECNTIIARAQDDPARLRLIADNLEVTLAVVADRLADAPVQGVLLECGEA